MIISLSWMYIDFHKPKRSKLKPINLSGVSDSNVRLLLFSKLSSDCTLRILGAPHHSCLSKEMSPSQSLC